MPEKKEKFTPSKLLMLITIIIILGIILVKCSNNKQQSKDVLVKTTVQNNTSQDTTQASKQAFVISEMELGTNNEKTMTFYQAQEYCKTLGKGWRLPNRKEMRSIYEIKDSIGFFGYYFWTSEEYSKEKAWYQYMGKEGTQHPTPKNTEKFVWPVRDRK